MIFVDFSGEDISLRGVKGVPWKDTFQLWECDVCWGEFVEDLGEVGRCEEMKGLFGKFREKGEAGTVIRVVDGVRRILGIGYERVV